MSIASVIADQLAAVKPAVAVALTRLHEAVDACRVLSVVLDNVPEVDAEGSTDCSSAAYQLQEFSSLGRAVNASLWSMETVVSGIESVIPGCIEEFIERYDGSEDEPAEEVAPTVTVARNGWF